MAQAARDENRVPTLLAVSNADGVTPVTLYADPVTHRLLTSEAGGGDVSGPGSSTDNAIVRWNGAAGTDVQNSGVIIDDTNNVTGMATLTLPNTGLHLLDTNATHDLIIVPGSNLTADHTFTITTGDADRTLTMAGDATISGTNTGDQTNITGNAATVTIVDAGGDTTTFPLLGTDATGNLSPATDAGLTYNANTNALTTTTFIGALNGNADTVTVADAGGDTTTFPLLGTDATGSLSPRTDAGLTYNANTNALTTTTFIGALTGNADTVTGFTPAGGSLTLAGADALTLTTSASTDVTLPTTGTLATLAGTEELDNKTLDASVAKGTWTSSSWGIPAGTLTGNITFGESTSLIYDAALSADGTYCGLVRAGTAGATLAFGDLIYLAAADSRWELADADAAATSGDVLLGMCVLAAASDGDPTTVLLQGFIRADAAFPSLTIGAPAYVSTTTGDIQVAQPSGTDDVIRRVGFAWTADELYFNPSNDYVTHT